MKGKKEPMITYFLSRSSSKDIKEKGANTNVRVIIRTSTSVSNMKSRK